MADSSRILILDGSEHSGQLVHDAAEAQRTYAGSCSEALSLVQQDHFAELLIDLRQPSFRQQLERFAQAQQIIEILPTGIAILCGEFRVIWANPTFEKRCDGPWQNRPVLEALGTQKNLGPDADPMATVQRTKQWTHTRLHTSQGLYLELHLAPLQRPEGLPPLYMARCRDVTAEVQTQQKLDALHKSGQTLANLDPDQLAEMTVEKRIALLKENLRKSIHELLNYHVIEIRLLNRQTNRLEPVLAEGMTEEAEHRELYALECGNGVTGYVAATGKSYLVPDTEHDSHYIKGAEGARSSMTVPLLVLDQVIGTFNVESPTPNAFGPQELKFAELFAREIAKALYILELLSAQRYCAASAMIKAVNREIALPVDKILASATSVLSQYLGHNSEMSNMLMRIIEQARTIKQNIAKVGEEAAPIQASPSLDGLSPTRLKGKRMLVVDADEGMLQSAHTVLEKLGCDVETAPTGREALMMASVSTYDAIIIDVKPPDMKGYDAYRQLRDAQPNARMIMMAGFDYDGGHTIVRARQDGLRHVLYKPFMVNQLINALESPDIACRPQPLTVG
ncbi:MAG TPA: response regulator [Gemmataceae bacterium]|nr:response regulator [Gemmataceae bacterium]